MKNKIGAIILYIIQAIPIPISLISILGTIISLANIYEIEMPSLFVGLIAIITMILAGTYLVTYIISLNITMKKKKLSFYSYLPLLHLALFILFIYLWSYLESFTII